MVSVAKGIVVWNARARASSNIPVALPGFLKGGPFFPVVLARTLVHGDTLNEIEF